MNLSLINPMLHNQARQALKDGDVDRFFGYADSLASMFLFKHNESEFLRRGLFEKALLCAWSNQKCTTFICNGECVSSDPFMRGCLTRANKDKLIEHSDPLPSGDVLTVYRGVSGRGEFRKVRGIAWSLSVTVARSFARYGYRPALYRTTVKRSDAFAYINESGREEQEVLLLLGKRHAVEKLSLCSAVAA